MNDTVRGNDDCNEQSLRFPRCTAIAAQLAQMELTRSMQYKCYNHEVTYVCGILPHGCNRYVRGILPHGFPQRIVHEQVRINSALSNEICSSTMAGTCANVNVYKMLILLQYEIHPPRVRSAEVTSYCTNISIA